MADHKSNDTFSFGRVRSPDKSEKENRSPAKLARGGKQTRVRFAEVESPASSASRNATADFAPTPPPVALSSHHASSDTPLAAPALETPIGARNLPTPFGTMGRAALPPTPYAPGSVTPSVAAAQLSSWRSRAANAAFKAKSPPTSRHSSPASSSGIPDNTSPLATGFARHSFFTELQSQALTSTAASPLATPGGRALGRGLDDSPCISGASGNASREMSLDSPAMVSGVPAAFPSPINTPEGPATSVHSPSTAALPTEGKAVLTESSSNASATPAEGAPQAFGSPSALWPAPAAAQSAQTDALGQATSDAAPTSTWDQLWDEGSSDGPDQADADSLPAESATQSAPVCLGQHMPGSSQQAEAVPSSQHVMPSQDAVAPDVQKAEQSAESSGQPSASSLQLPGHPSGLSDEAPPADSAKTPPHHASTSLEPEEALPEQAGPSQLISSWPDQATTPRLHTSLPEQATPSLPQGPGAGASGACNTPKRAGCREYGSWWTPPLPKGLTPAWMKVKTPARVKKMRQVELEDDPVQPVALDLVPLTPYLKPAPLPDLPQVRRAERKTHQQPRKEKGGFAVLCGTLLHLLVLLGAAWGSWTSPNIMPMMPMYHQNISPDSYATAPYMYSGELASHPMAAATYQYAASMLPQTAPAQPVAPLPSIAQIQQAFQDARQQPSPHVEADFSHAVVTAMRERMVQDTLRQEEVKELDVPDSAQRDDSSDEGLPEAAPAQIPSEEADDSGISHPAGTGASWQQDAPSGLRASLRNTWGRAMAAARAAHQPINFFFLGSRGQPQAHAEDSAELSSHGPYSPFPFITTEPFSRAWQETHQQAASMAGKLTSSAQSAAERALNSLQTAANGPSTALRHSWDVVSHSLSQRMDGASSLALSSAGAADSSGPEDNPAIQLSSVSDIKGEAASGSARGLAEASKDLMQSLDHLLESLDTSAEPDKPIQDAESDEGIAANHPRPQADTADAGESGSAKLTDYGRAQSHIAEQQQHKPQVQDFAADERRQPAAHEPSALQDGSARPWAYILHAAQPLLAIAAATTGIVLLGQLFFRSPVDSEEAEQAISPERRRSVSRRLSGSFSAMQNAASGEDAVSSVAAASVAVEAAEAAEYSIGHKAVPQLPQNKTPVRPRATAAQTEQPRGQYLLRSREVAQVSDHVHQQASGEVSSKSTVRRSSRHRQ